MNFHKSFLQALVESEEAPLILDEHVGKWRWGDKRRIVFRHGDKFYSVIYRTGDDLAPFEEHEDLIKCREVSPQTKTITVYVLVTETR